MPNCFVVREAPCEVEYYYVTCDWCPLGVDCLIGGSRGEEVEEFSVVLLGEPACEFVVWADWVSGLWGSHI